MNPVHALTLAALQHDGARLERIAANLANATTPAYRREMWVQRSTAEAAFGRRVDEAIAAHDAGPAQASDADDPGVSAASGVVHRDLRPGTLRPTGQPLDVALAGPGYLEVATPQGPAYTRGGALRLDPGGRLVTQDGLAVLAQGGEITLTGPDVAIDDAGRIHQAGRLVDQLRLVDFDAGSALTPLGAGRYASQAPARPVDDAQRRVRQGFLEMPNVDRTHEMVTLSQTLRHVESMVRLAQGYDDLLGISLRRLGEL